MTRERDRIQENANNCIVRNCPCIKHFEEVELDNRCMSTQDDKLFFCENNTDCVIKQVIEKCKEVENIKNVKTLYDAAQSGMFLQANRILKLFDIEEINK